MIIRFGNPEVEARVEKRKRGGKEEGLTPASSTTRSQLTRAISQLRQRIEVFRKIFIGLWRNSITARLIAMTTIPKYSCH